MRVQEIMSTQVATATSQEPAIKAWARMRDKGIHHLAVVDGGVVTGVITHRDLGGARGERTRAGATVGDLMSRDAVVVAPDTTVRQAANKMRTRAIGCLLVMDQGKLKGIITISDLLELIGQGLDRPLRRRERQKGRSTGSWGYPGGRGRR